MKTITITRKNLQGRMKAIETRNMKKRGYSKSSVSLLHYFNPCILEIYNNEILTIDEKKYREILHKALADEL